MNILVIRFSSIGDIVLCSPVVRALKQQLGTDTRIDFITKKPFAAILAVNPHIHRVITIEKHVSEAKAALRETHYDYIVDLHHNLRSLQVKRLVKSTALTVDKRNFAKWIYVNTKRELLPIGHFAERCLQCVAPLGVADDGRGLDFFIRTENEVALPAALQAGFVAYAIGGKMAGKILPTDKIIELCKRLNQPIALLGGTEDRQRGEEIATAVGTNVWNACGKFSLQQSADIIRQSRCLVSHDTGLMHIGAALGKRVVSLWLATTPLLGFAPWRAASGSVMVEADCKRRPTSKLGNRGYQDGCVFNLDLERVVQAVNA